MNFRDEPTIDTALRKGKAKGLVKVSNALMQQVEKGSLRAIIFYLKCRGGWREEETEIKENSTYGSNHPQQQYLNLGIL